MRIKALIYWLITCVLGSFCYSTIFNVGLSTGSEFYFSYGDLVVIALILFIISVIVTIPIFLIIRRILNSEFSKRKKRWYSNGLIFLLSILSILALYYPTRSFFDSGLIVISFVFFELLFLNIYIEKIDIRVPQ